MNVKKLDDVRKFAYHKVLCMCPGCYCVWKVVIEIAIGEILSQEILTTNCCPGCSAERTIGISAAVLQSILEE